MATVYKECDRTIAHLSGVGRELQSVARGIEGRARANLAQHRDYRRAHRIVTAHGAVDYYVMLVGPAALSIEFGHFVDNGAIDAHVSYVSGLGILRKALQAT